jgi:nucleotide-binding universal stress UspA family protein
MALKDILVHLDATGRAMARLGLAVELARQHEAHLTGLHVVDLTPPPIALGAEGVGTGVALAAVIEQMRRDALAQASGVETLFRERLRAEGLAGEWRRVEGITAEQVALHTRCADLAILGQQDPAAEVPTPSPMVEETLFSSGRPVLIVPFAGEFASAGRVVLIGWNGSREAARAAGDALPLLAPAASVTVLSVNTGGEDEEVQPSADMLVRHLARHGAKAEARRAVARHLGAGDSLLNHAANLGADLLVVGAYSHSRLRELVLGGVTRTLLRQMTLPVLMAH